MAVDNGGERVGQIFKRIDGVELARLDERGDGCPVLRSGIMPAKSAFLRLRVIGRSRLDRALIAMPA